jgi:magnesium transporter
MITVLASSNGQVTTTDKIDPAWLGPDGRVIFWVDLAAPAQDEAKRILSDTFRFHELAIEDALSTSHLPKVEPYDNYIYLILHGIDYEAARKRFATHDIDFFIGDRYLVTVHSGRSRSIRHVLELAPKNPQFFSDGPIGLVHRIGDTLFDNYRPEVERFEERMDKLEREVFTHPRPDLIRNILALKRDVVTLRQAVLPQRDVIGRLARREFPQIDTQMAYRFRDLHDHLVRLADETLMFQDRMNGLVEAHLSNVSNQLNQVMKILTVIATIFMPLTFITGLYGMNVDLPHFGFGADRMFWVLAVLMLTISGSMLWWFRSKDWM